MGSELSSQQNGNKVNKSHLPGQLRRGKTAPETSAEDDSIRKGSNSPGPSVCSDSDLPYISYTVNRPIGDSPKISSKQSGALQRGKSLGSTGNSPAKKKNGPRKFSGFTSKEKTGHEIVVVKAAKEPENQEKDPYLLKLQSIPMFLPIMRGTINLPGMRDPEILERLDPQDLLALCKRLQNYMALCSDNVAKNQNQITDRIRDVDFELCHLITTLGERQKRLSKQAEKISKVTEISQLLNKCHVQLNVTLELMEKLNNDLPVANRLEPFVWTTGLDTTAIFLEFHKMDNNVKWPKDVGILAMEVYIPVWYVDQKELEEYDGVSSGKYTIGLGQTRMTFCNDREDINSLCLTVTKNLLEKNRIKPEEIGRLEVGTETIIDKSKSVKTVLMQLFPENTDVEGIDTTNACYGGTAALFNSVNWVESSAWDQRYALVVCADIAVYAKGAARPTGGAGAIAMLVGPQAPLIIERGVRSTYMTHAYDFYKPNMTSEYPVVDGPLSIKSYFSALDKCYNKYKEKSSKCSSTKINSVRDFDGILFHCPYSKLVQKSVARLHYNDYLDSSEEEKRKIANVPEVTLENSYNNKDIEKIFTASSEEFFKAKTEPSLWLAKQVGNMYTPSLYGGLASYLLSKNPKELFGARLGLFSYGSGLASSFFSIKITSENLYGDKLKSLISMLSSVKVRIEQRCRVPPSDFEQSLLKREDLSHTVPYTPKTSFEKFFPGTFYLVSVDEKYRREYKRIPPVS